MTDNAALRAAIRGYVSAVVEDEWPRMALQERSARTDAALNALLREVAKPASAIDPTVQRTMLDMVLTVRRAHGDRRVLSNDRTVVTKWAAVMLLAFITQITIAVVYLERPRPHAAAGHLHGGGGIAARLARHSRGAVRAAHFRAAWADCRCVGAGAALMAENARLEAARPLAVTCSRSGELGRPLVAIRP